MLKDQVIAAVRKAVSQIESLAVVASLIKISASTYIPGQKYVPAETVYGVAVFFVAYEASEIDGDRVRASDWKGLVVSNSNTPDMAVGDLIRIQGMDNVPSGDYRIGFDDKVMVGATVLLHQLNLRKV